MLSQLTEWLVERDVREVNVQCGVEPLGEGIARVVEHLQDLIVCKGVCVCVRGCGQLTSSPETRVRLVVMKCHPLQPKKTYIHPSTYIVHVLHSVDPVPIPNTK